MKKRPRGAHGWANQRREATKAESSRASNNQGKKKKKKKPTFLARSPRSVQLYVRKMLDAILQSTSNEKMFIEGCYLVDIHNLSG